MAATQGAMGYRNHPGQNPRQLDAYLLANGLSFQESPGHTAAGKMLSEHARAALSFQLRENENRELLSPPPQAEKQTNRL